MATSSKRKPRRKNRGNIETLRNGSLRVRVYAGTDPITGKRYDLKEFIPASPDAEERADAALVRLVNEINERPLSPESVDPTGRAERGGRSGRERR